jgi:hypothetical protein
MKCPNCFLQICDLTNRVNDDAVCPRNLMGFEVIHDKDLAGTQLREQHLVQKGQQDRAIGAACDCHSRDQPLETQGAEQGDRVAPIDGLRRLRALAPRRTGVEAGHRLRAARCIAKDAVIRSQRLDGILQRGPLPWHVGPLWLGGAKRVFYAAGPVWFMAG